VTQKSKAAFRVSNVRVSITGLVRLLRPTHWIKNLFVLAGLFFSSDWRQPGLVAHALAAFAAFCLAASAVYGMNDALDVEEDREHPRKRLRPIASGLVPRNLALTLSGALALSSLVLSACTGSALLWIIVAYLAINILYSRALKNQVLLDVFCIASGFILRLLAGTFGIGIEPSQWFLLCTLALSLFLGFSKRYAELVDPQRPLEEKRKVLKKYSSKFLRMLLGITLSATLITYALYTTSSRTLEIHHTGNLLYTLPLVIFGLFRYLYLVIEDGFGENTVADLLKDKQLLFASVLYVIGTGSLLFLRSS